MRVIIPVIKMSDEIDITLLMCYNLIMLDYNFSSRSLRYQTTSLGAPGEMTSHPDKEHPIIASPNMATRLRVQKELAGTMKTIESKDGSGAIETAMLNTDASSEKGLRIYSMGIGGDISHPVAQLELQHLAAANPEQATLVLNNAGSGGSSRVPRDIMQKMKRSGSYTLQGEWTMNTLSEISEKYDNTLSFEGNSAGARLSLGMAAALLIKLDEYTVKHVRVMDPPGAKNHTHVGMLACFVRQAPHASGYRSSPYNPYRNENLHEEMTAHLFANKAGLIDNAWNHPMVMRKQSGFAKDIQNTIQVISAQGDLSIIQPESSEFAKPEDMLRAIGQASLGVTSLDQTPRIQHILLRRHSHAIMSDKTGPNPTATAYEIARYEAEQSHT